MTLQRLHGSLHGVCLGETRSNATKCSNWLPLHCVGPIELNNGESLVYVVDRDGIAQLYLRRLDEFEASPIPGTEGAYGPFFSPHSQWIGFFNEEGLEKVSIAGDLPELLCDAANVYGGTWGHDGTIYFSPNFGTQLRRITPSRGTRPLDVAESSRAAGIALYSWPEILPDCRTFLITACEISRCDSYGGQPLGLLTGALMRACVLSQFWANQDFFVRRTVFYYQCHATINDGFRGTHDSLGRNQRGNDYETRRLVLKSRGFRGS